MPQGRIGMWTTQCITNWIVEHVAHASSCVAGHVHIIEGIPDARRIRTLSSVEHECRHARHQSVRTSTRQTGPPLRWYVFSGVRNFRSSPGSRHIQCVQSYSRGEIAHQNSHRNPLNKRVRTCAIGHEHCGKCSHFWIFSAAHNGLVAGSNPAGSTNKHLSAARNWKLLQCTRSAPSVDPNKPAASCANYTSRSRLSWRSPFDDNRKIFA